MNDTTRTIDTERAGGVGNAGPKHAVAAPEMSYEEAVEYDRLFRWRKLPTKSDRAREALIREVERLHEVVCETYGWLKRNNLHTTAHGRYLGTTLGLLPRLNPAAQEDDGA